jgi:hypothetical protein
VDRRPGAANHRHDAKEPSGLFHFTVPIDSSPYEGLRSDKAGEAYNDFISAVAYAQAEYDWEHRTGCPF